MITTNDEQLYKKLLMLRTHGITRDTNLFQNSVEFAAGQTLTANYQQPTSNLEAPTSTYPAWYMEMQILGYNYRITDFQAALGNSQLKRAEQGIQRRREIAAKYAEAFTNKSFIKGQSGVVEGHAYHLYVIEVEDRLGLYNYLRTQNIFAQIHYIPCHLMPYYRSLGWKEGDRQASETYYEHCISLPIYPTLKEEEQNFVIQKIYEFFI
jgi:dTDP-4-amino-4,6-dideoxygalactose transaminase